MRLKLSFVLLFVAATAFAQLPAGEFRIAPPRTAIAPYSRFGPAVAASRDQFLTVWRDDRTGVPGLWAARASSSGGLLDAAGIHIPTTNYAGQPYALDVASDGTNFLVVWREPDGLKLARVFANGTVAAVANPGVDGAEAKLVWMGDSYVLFFLRLDGSFERRTRGVEALVLDREGRNLLGRRQTIVESPEHIQYIDAALGNGGTDVLFVWGDYIDLRLHAQTLPVAVLRAGNAVGVQPIPAATPDQRPLGVSVAGSGDGYLVTWIVFVDGNGLQYRVRHLDRNGIPDSPSFEVGRPGQNLAAPSVTWNGSHYVMATSGPSGTVQLFRFTRLGALVEETPLIVGNFGTWPAVESIGNAESFLTWVDVDAPGSVAQLHGDLFAGGALRFGGRQTLSQGHVDRTAPTVVWRGDHYLGAWRETDAVRRVAFGRFSTTGQPIGATVHPGSGAGGESEPSLAGDGSSAVVVWTERDSLRSAFIDPAGNVTVRTLVTGTSFGKPLIHWNGTQYAVVWAQTVSGTRSILGLRLGRNGAPLDSSALTLRSTDVSDATVLAWTGSQYVVVWQHQQSLFPPFPPQQQELLMLTRDLVPISSTPLAFFPTRSGGAAESNAGVLLTWVGVQTGGVQNIRGTRITPGGTLLDPQGLSIGPWSGTPSAYGVPGGWVAVSGPYSWLVTPNSVGPRQSFAPFIPDGTEAVIVTGGPAPLAVWRQVKNGIPDVYARFILARQRAVRR